MSRRDGIRLPENGVTGMVRRLISTGRSCTQVQGGSSTCKFDRLVLTLAILLNNLFSAT